MIVWNVFSTILTQTSTSVWYLLSIVLLSSNLSLSSSSTKGQVSMPEVTEPLTLAPEETKTKANLNDVNGNSTLKDSATTPRTHLFDPNFTQNVINATGPKTSPRMRKVMTSLIQHIHDFARENEITIEEWMAAVDFVSISGRRLPQKLTSW